MKKKSLFVLYSFLFCAPLLAQEIYFSNSFLDPVAIGTVDLNDACATTPLITFTDDSFARGIAIAPDGTFYAMIRNQDVGENLLSVVDLNNGTYTTAVDFSNLDFPRHLAFSPEGVLYFGVVGTLYSYDFVTNQTTMIGLIGADNELESLILGLTFANGKFYAATQDTDDVEKVYKVNLNDSENSELVTLLPDNIGLNQASSMTTVNNGCGQTVTYIIISEFGGDRVHEIDLSTGDMTLVCNSELANFKGATSTTDAAYFDCAPELDLDADDSTTTGNDYIAEETCAADSVCFLSDTDIQITSSFLVDSFQIYFASTPLDGNAEGLFCKENAALDCFENNANGGITLYNSDDLDDFAVSQALNNSIYYQNIAQIPTFGDRTFAVIAYDSCFISDTAFVTLPIITPIPDTSFFAFCPTESFELDGNIYTSDTTICSLILTSEGCDSFTCINLVFAFPETIIFDSFCEGSTYQFLDQTITAGGTYRDTLPTGGICDSIVVLELEEIPTPTITFVGNTTLCDGTTAELSIAETYPIYNWSTGEITSNIIISEANNYALTVTNAEGCTGSNQIDVTIENPLEADVDITDLTCGNLNNGNIEIVGVSGGVAPYLYALNGGNFSDEMTFSNLTAGDYDLIIEDAEGCQLSLNLTINESIPLVVNVASLFEINLGESLLLNLQTNATAIQNIDLQPAGSFTQVDSLQFLFFPQQNTDYNLVLTDENDCSTTANFTFLVQQSTPIFAPNVFSPNQDGINDVFQFFTNESVQTIENFRVFNRWGGLVFDDKNTDFWDGNVNKESAEMGVYVYFLEYVLVTGERGILEGEVLLLR